MIYSKSDHHQHDRRLFKQNDRCTTERDKLHKNRTGIITTHVPHLEMKWWECGRVRHERWSTALHTDWCSRPVASNCFTAPQTCERTKSVCLLPSGQSLILPPDGNQRAGEWRANNTLSRSWFRGEKTETHTEFTSGYQSVLLHIHTFIPSITESFTMNEMLENQINAASHSEPAQRQSTELTAGLISSNLVTFSRLKLFRWWKII